MILLTPLHSESESHSSPHPTAPSAASLPHREKGLSGAIFALALLSFAPSPARAALNIPITVNLSESVNVTGTPQIAVDVGGTTRYATYTSGTSTNALTFTLAPQAGDVDLDGVTVSSPIQLNGGTIKDSKGNNATLTFTPPNTSNVKVNYPSLGMDFVYDADGRYTLNGTPYNDLASFLTAAGGSFTRASVGTYYDSTGILQTAASGVPRFDYDPVTHAAKGILIEEARTNLILRSSEMDNAVWAHGASITVTANTTDTTAPDGSNSAEKIAINSTAAVTFIQTGLTVTGTVATYSIFVKQGSSATTGNAFCLRNQTTATNLLCGSLNYATDVFTYTIGSSGVTVQDFPNGWKRLIMTATSGISSGNQLIIYVGYTGSSCSPTNYLYAWGAQLEAGAFPTSYIPTTTAAVTRANETLSIPTSGWFSLPESTMYLQAEAFGLESSGRFGAGFGSSSSDYFAFPYVSTTGIPNSLYYRSAGAGPVLNGNPVLSFNTLYKTAGSYSVSNNTASYSKNGALSATGSGLSAMASATTLYVGTAPFNPSSATSGHYQKLKYYPARATDTQLQLLTQ